MRTSGGFSPIIIAGLIVGAAIVYAASRERPVEDRFQLASYSSILLRMNTHTGEIEQCHPATYPAEFGGGYAWRCDSAMGVKAVGQASSPAP